MGWYAVAWIVGLVTTISSWPLAVAGAANGAAGCIDASDGYLQFDGSSQSYATVPIDAAAFNSSGSFSACIWVRRRYSASIYTLLSHGSPTVPNRSWRWTVSSTAVSVSVGSSPGSFSYSDSTERDIWRHYCFTHSLSKLRIVYRDGVFFGSNNAGATKYEGGGVDSVLGIGTPTNGVGPFFVGALDQILVYGYGRVLTPNDVWIRYNRARSNAEPSDESSLALSLGFNSPLHAQDFTSLWVLGGTANAGVTAVSCDDCLLKPCTGMADVSCVDTTLGDGHYQCVSGTNNRSSCAAPATCAVSSTVVGGGGAALTLNGANRLVFDSIRVNGTTGTASDFLRRSFSICMWVWRSADLNSGLLSYGSSGDTAQSILSISWSGSQFRTLIAGTPNGFTGPATQIRKWMHFCFTADRTAGAGGGGNPMILAVHLDGVRAQEAAGEFDVSLNRKLIIGGGGDHQNLALDTALYFIGLLDDLRMYSGVLSVGDVERLQTNTPAPAQCWSTATLFDPSPFQQTARLVSRYSFESESTFNSSAVDPMIVPIGGRIWDWSENGNHIVWNSEGVTAGISSSLSISPCSTCLSRSFVWNACVSQPTVLLFVSDDCLAQPCVNGGTCIDSTGGDGYYTCQCTSGFDTFNCANRMCGSGSGVGVGCGEQ